LDGFRNGYFDGSSLSVIAWLTSTLAEITVLAHELLLHRVPPGHILPIEPVGLGIRALRDTGNLSASS
jgi:hypothetical protein